MSSIINLKDRFGRSLVAGLFSSIVLFALNLFSYYVLNFSNRRYINYAAYMIFGREFESLAEAIVSSMAQIGFATGLIIIFSFFILRGSNYIWRGLFVGLGSWFAIVSIMYMIGIHEELPINITSAISFMITSSTWGILAAWSLHKLDERYGGMD